jgi:hypothetical protein
MHLLFLGWATTLVYAVGYRLFPVLLGRQPPTPGIAWTQVLAAVVGSALLTGSFLVQTVSHTVPGPGLTSLTAIGGVLAALGAIIFLLQWPLCRPR